VSSERNTYHVLRGHTDMNTEQSFADLDTRNSFS